MAEGTTAPDKGPVFFEDLEVGGKAPVRTLTLTRTDLVRYAGASRDFNPLHHDDERARAAGMKSVFGHGMFSAGLLATALTDLVGVGNLRGYKVRFTTQAWPGDALSTDITVTGKDEATGTVQLDCQVVNTDGKAVVAGSAVATPVRARGNAGGPAS
ncbi:MaoC family dehydratase N-terminal domain-containing protein [Frankia sp. CNm7]|uniref:MaoC family dehydratase N-terminal domain-containing protein n=1 Tax=Frankia nepalensis TaxID=1836974 RepID=A0A937RDN9_9ACTN|nr:MaoC/PaaZ C-terminal domain-containing protein [Frankia nepalensis]MBL7500031.1 MaoC family dehydratase N-terminal domain-containing protein [Frankia nepalensis]MBL7511540.1 MaoC family dehydratase N-terminal domain-containing protein [Frankia nepalensis]MBL7521004.1 MaoC family dehydratase N-terminal domain-containing protein [Frankia nepalensis]MBL7628520.1 MaoC family dehydratase N-terminal domain-containing protein [Frankia nepalensis]